MTPFQFDLTKTAPGDIPVVPLMAKSDKLPPFLATEPAVFHVFATTLRHQNEHDVPMTKHPSVNIITRFGKN